MTVEAYAPPALMTVQGTGPYAFNHAIRAAEDIDVWIETATTRVLLAAPAVTVTPNSGSPGGVVTLSASAAATHAGATLRIDRSTRIEQGWIGATAREKGLERQIDATVMALQELREATDRAIRLPRGDGAIADMLADATERAGKLLAFDAQGRPTALALALPPAVTTNGDIRNFGAVWGAGEGAATATRLAIQAAIDHWNALGGGVVKVPAGIWWIDRPLIMGGANVRLEGEGAGTVIRLAFSAFVGSTCIAIWGSSNVVSDLVLDGNRIVSTPISGVVAAGTGSQDCRVERVTVTRLSSNGIVATDNGTQTVPGSITHVNFQVLDCKAVDVGWCGIFVQGCIRPKIKDCEIAFCGFHGIAVLYHCFQARVLDNFVTRALPPFWIYPGLLDENGNAKQGGFMIAYVAEASDTLIRGNICVDNRQAEQDGIGLGENGVQHGRAIVAQNIVVLAGLFGIDAAGNDIVQGNQVYEAAQFGIAVTLDKGGILGPGIVQGNLIVNCSGADAIAIRPAFHGDPLTHTDLIIADNVMADFRTPKVMQYGIGLYTRVGSLVRNMLISGNVAMEVAISGFNFGGDGTQTQNVFKSNNLFKGDPRGDTDLTLLNGWFHASALQLLQVYNAGDGLACISGSITGGTTTPGTAICVLPPGLRPRTAGTYQVSPSTGGIGFVQILTDGTVQIGSGFAAGVNSFNGIVYRIGA